MSITWLRDCIEILPCLLISIQICRCTWNVLPATISLGIRLHDCEVTQYPTICTTSVRKFGGILRKRAVALYLHLSCCKRRYFPCSLVPRLLYSFLLYNFEPLIYCSKASMKNRSGDEANDGPYRTLASFPGSFLAAAIYLSPILLPSKLRKHNVCNTQSIPGW